MQFKIISSCVYQERTHRFIAKKARVDEEMQRLLKDIRRVGEAGKPEVTFGELFVDPEVEQYYVALVGTLKSAKKRGLIYFEGQMLLKGPSDNILISIVNQWDDTI